jgi:hypothetical protein
MAFVQPKHRVCVYTGRVFHVEEAVMDELHVVGHVCCEHGAPYLPER